MKKLSDFLNEASETFLDRKFSSGTKFKIGDSLGPEQEIGKTSLGTPVHKFTHRGRDYGAIHSKRNGIKKIKPLKDWHDHLGS